MSARELSEALDLSVGQTGYEQLVRLLQALQKSQPKPDDEDGVQFIAYDPEIDEVDSYAIMTVSE